MKVQFVPKKKKAIIDQLLNLEEVLKMIMQQKNKLKKN